jgi:hypothetical protein
MKCMSVSRCLGVWAVVTVAMAGAVAGVAMGQGQPVGGQPMPLLQPAAGLSAVDPKVDDALDKIEAADKTLVNMTAPIRLIRRFPAIQGGGEHTRFGTIFYSVQPAPAGQPPLRKFALVFETLDVRGAAGEQPVRRDDKQSFIFDGTWLLEMREADKFFVRRRIVAPGIVKDPVRIGEGPFPLPIGQRKADMLQRFVITLVDPLDSAPDNARLRQVLAGCTQIKLVPKVDTPGARDFREIRLWYRANDWMPIFAQTINLDDSSAEVFIILGTDWNKPLNAAVFNTTPPSASEGWRGDTVEQVQGNASTQPAPADPNAPQPMTEIKPKR